VVNSNSNIATQKTVYDDVDYTAVSIEDLEGRLSMFVLSNNDASASKEHRLEIGSKIYAWEGPYYYTEK
jgi:hypothetical protein